MEFSPTVAASICAAIVMCWSVFSDPNSSDTNTDTSLIGIILMVPIVIAVIVGIVFLVPILLGLLGIALIVGIAGGLIYGLVKILRSDWLRPFLRNAFTGIKSLLKKIGSGMKSLVRMLWKSMKKASSVLKSLFAKTIKALKKVIGKLLSSLRPLLSSLKKTVTNAFRVFVKIFREVVHSLGTIVKKGVRVLKKALKSVVRFVRKALRELNAILRSIGKKFPLLAKIGKILLKPLKALWNIVKKIAKEIASVFRGGLKGILKTLRETLKKAWGILKMLGKKFPLLAKIGRRITKATSGLLRLVKKAGKAIENLLKKIASVAKRIGTKFPLIAKVAKRIAKPLKALRRIFKKAGDSLYSYAKKIVRMNPIHLQAAVRSAIHGVKNALRKMIRILRSVLRKVFWPIGLLLILLKRRSLPEKQESEERLTETVLNHDSMQSRDAERSQKVKETVSNGTAESVLHEQRSEQIVKNSTVNNGNSENVLHSERNKLHSPENTTVVVDAKQSTQKENETVTKSQESQVQTENIHSPEQRMSAKDSAEKRLKVQTDIAGSVLTEKKISKKSSFSRLKPRFLQREESAARSASETSAAEKKLFTLPESLPLDRIAMEETGKTSGISFALGEVIDETRATEKARAGIDLYAEPLFR